MKRLRRTRFAASVSVCSLVLAWSVSAFADADSVAASAQSEITAVDREVPSVAAAVARAKAQKLTVEQRLTTGELLYRTKDYARAEVVLSEILEEFPDTPSYPDALWLRGETYYSTKEYLSARRDYRAIVDHGTEPRFEPYFGRALARLVDVCLRINDIKGLDDVFSKLNQVPPAQVDAALIYAKGKAYFAKQDYANAQQSFAAVPAKTQYTHQARYYLGLVAMKTTPPGSPASPDGTKRAIPANYKNAIDVFHQATDLPPDSDDHMLVIDLSWMAIGRLYYEMDRYAQASEAYSRVRHDSPVFSEMLYELAWDYVRLGDVQRAERALEVLSVADPSSPLIGDGSLLRADLLLRAGAFDKSLELYQGVKEQYDPMRVKVEAFLDQTQDVSVYYDKLSQQQLDVLDQNEQLPTLAVRWAREAEDGPMAFAVIDDVNECKTLIRQSYQLIDRLSTIVNAANRVRAFPELEAGEEQALGLINRLSAVRLSIAKGLDGEEPAQLTGEIDQVRVQRRTLMANMQGLPMNAGDFARRDYDGTKDWNTLSQELSRRAIEVDYLNATINGLRRMLKEDAQRGVTRDAPTMQRFNDELDSNEKELKQRQQDIVDLRRLLEIGRAQIGFGDARYQNDALARVQFRDALDREVALAAQGQAGNSAQAYAARTQPVLQQARATEDKLVASFQQMETEVALRIQGIKDKIEAERLKINGYNMQLGGLDREARDLVGHVAKRNFGLVRDRLRNIVLRADVGITEQAWEVREEELDRVHNLQTERAREEQLLDEELHEVLDDSGDSNASKGAK